MACGLLMRNEALIRSSTKSISEPARYPTEGLIDQHGCAVSPDRHIVGSLSMVHVELVLETGAAAALHAHAKHGGHGCGYALANAGHDTRARGFRTSQRNGKIGQIQAIRAASGRGLSARVHLLGGARARTRGRKRLESLGT
jgi:hypothetical protein